MYAHSKAHTDTKSEVRGISQYEMHKK